MDYSKFDTLCVFYKAQEEVYPGITMVENTVLHKVVGVLGSVSYQKLQEYNSNEREVKRCVIKLPWNPLLQECTHVEVKTYYETNLYTIEIQQMPFQGEVEMSCLDANREIGTFVREVRK